MQCPTPSMAAVSAWARRKPPLRSRSSICNAMRWAVFCPTPGRMRKASISWRISGLKLMEISQ
ncbi:hypothetical protein D3C81_1971180 [compost metagenome]